MSKSYNPINVLNFRFKSVTFIFKAKKGNVIFVFTV